MAMQSRIGDPKLEDAVYGAIDMSEEGAPIEDVMAKFFDGIIAPLAKAGDKQAAVLLDVVEHSTEYWTKHNAGRKDRNLLREGSKVIIADGIGALHGLILGPIVSIVEGAAVSVAANEGWF